MTSRRAGRDPTKPVLQIVTDIIFKLDSSFSGSPCIMGMAHRIRSDRARLETHPVSSRRTALRPLENGVKVTETVETAFHCNIEYLPIGHRKLLCRVPHPRFVQIVSRCPARTFPQSSRHMLGAATGKLRKGVCPLPKVFHLTAPACQCGRKPVRHFELRCPRRVPKPRGQVSDME